VELAEKASIPANKSLRVKRTVQSNAVASELDIMVSHQNGC
jgi:hypothetical protein